MLLILNQQKKKKRKVKVCVCMCVKELQGEQIKASQESKGCWGGERAE